ncbi:MAG: CHAD domain-containing protein, partial [Verrucomicrobiaceae bacterium]|nr:CHAD domain-containing protein [Verrucomicrobiaceae bacterium]
ALLRLAHDCVPDHTFEAMRMHLRAVKNACAGNRDRVVRDKLVEKLSRRFHLAPQHRIEKRARLAAPPATFLRHQLCALEQLVETTRMENLSPEQIIAAHAVTYRRGRRLMKEAFEGPEARTLHRWRHRVKDIHYQTLALPHLPGAARRVRRARKLGGILGRERDLAALAHEPAYVTKRGPWSHLIQEHRSKLRERCLVLGHKLYDPAAQEFQRTIVRRLAVS